MIHFNYYKVTLILGFFLKVKFQNSSKTGNPLFSHVQFSLTEIIYLACQFCLERRDWYQEWNSAQGVLSWDTEERMSHSYQSRAPGPCSATDCHVGPGYRHERRQSSHDKNKTYPVPFRFQTFFQLLKGISSALNTLSCWIEKRSIYFYFFTTFLIPQRTLGILQEKHTKT